MVDLVAVATDGSEANAQVFQVRDGILADRKSFHLDNIGEVSDNEVTEEFIAQYYTSGGAVPPQVIVAADFEKHAELEAVCGLLKSRRGAGVEIRSAERGEKRKLFELAE